MLIAIETTIGSINATVPVLLINAPTIATMTSSKIKRRSSLSPDHFNSRFPAIPASPVLKIPAPTTNSPAIIMTTEFENPASASAGVKIFNITKPDFPLTAYTDLSSFKLYMSDVGLLRRKANLDSKIIIEGNRLFEEFKGALTENFILNMLLFKFEGKPSYYTFDRHEIDFMLQYKNEIIPIEVKSSENINNVSLTRFNETNSNKISVRFSARNLDMSGKIINVPIFMAEYVDKLIEFKKEIETF